jgi:hypothetical protein
MEAMSMGSDVPPEVLSIEPAAEDELLGIDERGVALKLDGLQERAIVAGSGRSP